MFYWLAVIFTFAMGTALGDLFATTFHLGYLASAFVFTALICVPLVAWRLGASFYAGNFVGRKMADGTIMNPRADNAASKTLPLGTVAR